MTVESEPPAQTVHTVFPGKFLNVPVAHSVQVSALAPEKPALQVQAVRAALKTGEFEFAGHALHEVAPAPAPYLPTAQFVHTVPMTWSWNFPAGHTEQALLPTCEYLPTPQDTHVADPVASLYVPPAHAVHVYAFVYVYPPLQVHAASVVLPAGEFELL